MLIDTGVHIFRVYGEPQPFPKKEMSFNPRTKRQIVRQRDYQTFKDNLTGRIKKYNFGHKKAWAKLVRREVLRGMRSRSLQPYPQHHAIAIGCLFFMGKAESNKLEFPSIAPDLDNLCYAVWNILGRTNQRQKPEDGFYPQGVLYYDDSQIVMRLHPEGMFWADPSKPGREAGVVIQVVSMENPKLKEIMERGLANVGHLQITEQLQLVGT